MFANQGLQNITEEVNESKQQSIQQLSSLRYPLGTSICKKQHKPKMMIHKANKPCLSCSALSSVSNPWSIWSSIKTPFDNVQYEPRSVCATKNQESDTQTNYDVFFNKSLFSNERKWRGLALRIGNAFISNKTPNLSVANQAQTYLANRSGVHPNCGMRVRMNSHLTRWLIMSTIMPQFGWTPPVFAR